MRLNCKLPLKQTAANIINDEGATHDAERENALSVQGIQIIRFSNRDILLNREGIYEVNSENNRTKTKYPLTSVLSPRGEEVN